MILDWMRKWIGLDQKDQVDHIHDYAIIVLCMIHLAIFGMISGKAFSEDE